MLLDFGVPLEFLEIEFIEVFIKIKQLKLVSNKHHSHDPI